MAAAGARRRQSKHRRELAEPTLEETDDARDFYRRIDYPQHGVV
jgi:hypothetical protein